MNGRAWIAVGVVVVPLVVYPLVALAQGAPGFPTRSECIHPAVEGQPVAVVFGRFADPVSADRLRDRALSVGFQGTEALPDGCGRWKVLVAHVPDVTVGRGVQEEAQKVGLHPTLELDSSG